MIQLPDVKDVVQKVREDLKDVDWGEKLRMYLTGMEFRVVIDELMEFKRCGLAFEPALRDAFVYLHLTQYKNIKAVILADASNKHGIPLSYPMDYKGIVSANTDILLRGMHMDNRDLSKWCRQGVLMIPLATTKTINGERHNNIWQSMIVYIIDKINEKYKDIPWVLINSKAFQYRSLVTSKYIKELDLYKKPDNGWSLWVNQQLKKKGKGEIKW